jgi:hypothetical protein
LNLGFIGFNAADPGWLEAICATGLTGKMAIAECAQEFTENILRIQPAAVVLDSWVDLQEVGLAGVLIATPGAAHVEQAIAALERGMAVFRRIQPGANAPDGREVICTARKLNRLWGTDLPSELAGHRGDAGVIEWLKQLAAGGKFDPLVEPLAALSDAQAQLFSSSGALARR